MAKYPKISIVTPSFNQAGYLEQTIKSVVEQDYPNLEYIIIDGGSTDGSVDIIKKYEHKITYWESKEDSGQTDAINKGFLHCTGEIFNWINSDDYYAPGAFKKIADGFSDSKVSCVCGKEFGFYDHEPGVLIQHSGSIIKSNVFETIVTGIIDQPCTFFRKEVLKTFFPLNSDIRYVMDRELWLKYLLKEGQQNIRQIDDVLTYFRLHQNSKSVSFGDHFENEFKSIQRSLLYTVGAPDIILHEYAGCAEIKINWKEIHFPGKPIYAAYAFSLAQKAYIKGEIEKAASLIQIAITAGLTWSKFRLLMLSKILPFPLVKLLRRLKFA